MNKFTSICVQCKKITLIRFTFPPPSPEIQRFKSFLMMQIYTVILLYLVMDNGRNYMELQSPESIYVFSHCWGWGILC